MARNSGNPQGGAQPPKGGERIEVRPPQSPVAAATVDVVVMTYTANKAAAMPFSYYNTATPGVVLTGTTDANGRAVVQLATAERELTYQFDTATASATVVISPRSNTAAQYDWEIDESVAKGSKVVTVWVVRRSTTGANIRLPFSARIIDSEDVDPHSGIPVRQREQLYEADKGLTLDRKLLPKKRWIEVELLSVTDTSGQALKIHPDLRSRRINYPAAYEQPKFEPKDANGNDLCIGQSVDDFLLKPRVIAAILIVAATIVLIALIK